jgi:lipoyl(octanoyl) transferase
MMMRIWWLGRREYRLAHALQRRLADEVAAGEAPDTLLLLEHDPVITCGRGTDATNLPDPGGSIPVVGIERGGDVTWHGPGQLVGYPILGLRDHERDLHLHLRRIEDLLIRTCIDLGCTASRNPGFTGVWTPADQPARKLASIGVAVRRWVTYHGFALNVNVDRKVFDSIKPCGLDSEVMTSLDQECPQAPELPSVVETLARHLSDIFEREPKFERAPGSLLA